MADVTTTFAAKDESFATTVDKLNGRLQGFQKETQSFSGKVGDMAKGFSAFAIPIAGVAAAFFGARGAVAAFNSAIDLGGSLDDLTKRTGMAAGEILVLQEAFKLGGSSADAVGPTIDKLRRSIVAAGEGSGAQAAAFSRLGINLEQIKSATPTEQLETVSRALKNVSNDTDRSALAMDIFGKSGGALLPLLNDFAGELSKAQGYLGSLPGAMDEGAKALADLGDNFAAIGEKVNQFVAGALADIAPHIVRATEELAKMDFAAMGMKLSEALTRAFDVFRALWNNPKEIVGLFGDYLNATFRQAGDSLLSSFLTATSALSNTLSALLKAEAFDRLGDVMANAFIYAAAQLNLRLFDVVEGVLNFWGGVWDLVTGRGTKDLAGKLYDVVKFFASDFFQAMTNPMGFISRKVASSLLDATKEAAIGYQYAVDAATGSYIEKARSGLEFVARDAGSALSQSASEFGNALVAAGTEAAANTEIIKVNLFGGAEAIERINSRVAALAEQGAAFRAEMEASVPPAEEISMLLAEIPQHATDLKDAFSNSFPLAAAIKEEAAAMAREGQLFQGHIAAASIDAHVTANAFTGMSDRMSKATNETSAMLDKMREAFHFGQKTQQEIYQQARDAGQSIAEASKTAAEYAAQRARETEDMRNLEAKARSAQEKYDREMAKAARQEQAGQENAAHNTRMRAQESLTKALETIAPDLEKATEAAKKNLEEGSDNIGKSGEAVGAGGAEAGAAMETGGKNVEAALTKAADPFKEFAKMISAEKLAMEKTLQKCSDFLKSIDKKLPQHALA